MSTAAAHPGVPDHRNNTFMGSIWGRQLYAYPDTSIRMVQLALVVLTTIVLYYENYVGGGVAPQLLANLHMSFTYYVTALAIANLVGAFASLTAGLADRFGRANLVVYGLLVTGLVTFVALPHAHSEFVFVFETVVVGFVEGIILVATPALVRDFSPQVGRATAMGFWTMGPVLGSLVVSVVATQTLPHLNPDWQGQYDICGVVGIAMFVVAWIGLRELSPQLRDQLMVSMRERELVEARARGLDIDASLRNPWRQMLHLDIIASAVGVSLMLLIYYTAVGFGAIYFETLFGFSAQQANGIGNWDWAANAIALLVVGVASDKLRVRKPFMVVGGVLSAVMVAIYLSQASGHPSYSRLALIVSLLSIGLGLAYAPWMASFTETVEARNPALTATGLAIWGWIIRITIFGAFLILPHVVSSSTPLVNYGGQVQAYAATYKTQLATAAKIDPGTSAALSASPTATAPQIKALSEISGLPATTVGQVAVGSVQYANQFATLSAIKPATVAALQANPGNTTAQAGAVGDIVRKFGISPTAAIGRLQGVAQIPPATLAAVALHGKAVQAAGVQLAALGKVPKPVLAYLGAHAAAVQKAAKDSPGQWKDWYWICFAGVIAFLPMILLMKGRWSPRKAREDAEERERTVKLDLDALHSGRPAPAGIG